MKKVIPIIVLLILGALGAWVYLQPKGSGLSGDSLTLTGTIEATEVALSPKIAERIEWLCCEVGDRVGAGQAVVRLDERELRALLGEALARVEAATAAIKEARVTLEERRVAVETAGFSVESARSEVKKAESLALDAKKEYTRIDSLVKKGFVSKSAFDKALAAYDSAGATLEAARAKLKSEEARLRNARVAVRRAQAALESAMADRKKDLATVDVLRTRLSYAVITTPISGVVAYKAFEAGEMAVPGQAIYTLYDLNDIWARVDIPETVISRLRLGASAEVWTEGEPGRVVKAVVSEIGQIGEFATHKDVVRVSHDIKTFRVKARLADPLGYLKPGMTCKVRIFFKKAHGRGSGGAVKGAGSGPRHLAKKAKAQAHGSKAGK